MSMKKETRHPRFTTLMLGFTIAAGLIFLLADKSFTNPTLWQQVFIAPNGEIFLFIVILTMMHVGLGGLKWQLISHQWFGPADLKAYSYYAQQSGHAALLGQFLPQSLATLWLRALDMKKHEQKTYWQGGGHGLYDLGFDFLAAMIFVPASLFYLFKIGDAITSIVLTGAVFMMAAGLFIAVRYIKIDNMPTFSFLKNIIDMIREWQERGLFNPIFVFKMLLLSCLRFILLTARLIAGAAFLHLTIPSAMIAAATPLATLPMILPITPANIGTAEWAWVGVLALWHIPIAIAGFYALGFRLLAIGAQIIAALCWMIFRFLTTAPRQH
jgi:Lysylphosphatidylglycerol synthase TM region